MKALKRSGFAAIILSTVLWGVSYVNLEYCLQFIPPMLLNALRFALAYFTLSFLTKISTQSEIQLDVCVRKLASLSGVLGIAIYYSFTSWSYAYLNSATISVLNGTIPVFVLLVEWAIYKRQPRYVQLLAIFLSILGIFLVAEKGPGAGNNLAGYLLMLLAIASWVAYVYLQQHQMNQARPLILLLYQTKAAALFYLPLTICEWILGNRPSFAVFSAMGGGQLTPLLLHFLSLSLLASALAYYLYNLGLASVDVTTSSLILNLMPVFTFITSVVLLKQLPAPRQWAGLVCVLGGVFLIGASQTRSVVEEE